LLIRAAFHRSIHPMGCFFSKTTLYSRHTLA
jgi:hypothetical protein